MERQRRVYLTGAEKAEMWRRWQAGQSMREIGRMLSANHGSVRGALLRNGGVLPTPRGRGAGRLHVTVSKNAIELLRRIRKPGSSLNGRSPAYLQLALICSAWWRVN